MKAKFLFSKVSIPTNPCLTDQLNSIQSARDNDMSLMNEMIFGKKICEHHQKYLTENNSSKRLITRVKSKVSNKINHREMIKKKIQAFEMNQTVITKQLPQSKGILNKNINIIKQRNKVSFQDETKKTYYNEEDSYLMTRDSSYHQREHLLFSPATINTSSFKHKKHISMFNKAYSTTTSPFLIKKTIPFITTTQKERYKINDNQSLSKMIDKNCRDLSTKCQSLRAIINRQSKSKRAFLSISKEKQKIEESHNKDLMIEHLASAKRRFKEEKVAHLISFNNKKRNKNAEDTIVPDEEQIFKTILSKRKENKYDSYDDGNYKSLLENRKLLSKTALNIVHKTQQTLRTIMNNLVKYNDQY